MFVYDNTLFEGEVRISWHLLPTLPACLQDSALQDRDTVIFKQLKFVFTVYTTTFDSKQLLLHFPHNMYVCVTYDCHNKQLLFIQQHYKDEVCNVDTNYFLWGKI
jgi:hypothetical protein